MKSLLVGLVIRRLILKRSEVEKIAKDAISQSLPWCRIVHGQKKFKQIRLIAILMT